MPDLNPSDIEAGKTYRAKKPRQYLTGELNDRTVLHVDSRRSRVQYDGPAVKDGRQYPFVSMDQFIKWAAFEVASEPEGE